MGANSGLIYKTRVLKKSDDTAINNLSDYSAGITSETIEMKGDKMFGVQVISTLDVKGTFTIEHSLDGTNFAPYCEEVKDIDLEQDFNEIKVDIHCVAPFLRFKFDFSAASSGNYTVKFMEKYII